MNAKQVATLTNWMVSTWPNGVRGHIWNAVFADMDHDRAVAVYERLRDTEQRPPSVALFRWHYDTADNAPSTRPDCTTCGGDGLLRGRNRQDGTPFAVPCPACPAGAERHRTAVGT